MNDRIESLRLEIGQLQGELRNEMARVAERFTYTVTERRVIFEAEAAAYQARLRQHWLRFLLETRLTHLMTAPFIYSLIVPLLLLDALVMLFQWSCFPIYGIKPVPRRHFIAFDRNYLHYLNIFERFHCAYCSYANGLLAYTREVAARTEAYWCPIKHARRLRDAHQFYNDFEEYGDAEGYRERVQNTYRRGYKG